MIYRGWGFIALLIPVVCMLIGTSLFGVNGNMSLEVFLYSLMASGVVVFLTGIWMNRKSRHDMWFIPVQYWGIVWVVVAAGILAFRMIRG